MDLGLACADDLRRRLKPGLDTVSTGGLRRERLKRINWLSSFGFDSSTLRLSWTVGCNGRLPGLPGMGAAPAASPSAMASKGGWWWHLARKGRGVLWGGCSWNRAVGGPLFSEVAETQVGGVSFSTGDQTSKPAKTIPRGAKQKRVKPKPWGKGDTWNSIYGAIFAFCGKPKKMNGGRSETRALGIRDDRLSETLDMTKVKAPGFRLRPDARQRLGGKALKARSWGFLEQFFGGVTMLR